MLSDICPDLSTSGKVPKKRGTSRIKIRFYGKISQETVNGKREAGKRKIVSIIRVNLRYFTCFFWDPVSTTPAWIGISFRTGR